jgi:D-alanyl-D-alanine carboxypeptidase (penicillin-binding protein 5/6)
MIHACFLSALVLFAAAPAKKAFQKKTTARRPSAVRVVRPAEAKSAPQSAYRRDPYVGALSADAQTGDIIFSDGADNIAYPASVTKVMTALLVLEDVKARKYNLSDSVVATEDVYKCEPSWVGIKVGQSMSVDDLLMALMVRSANDAAIALGVKSSGSLEAFVEKMNTRAKELGMTNTEYFNPNGLPAPKYGKRFNRTTARDQLKLALEIIKHPEIFKYTSSKTASVTLGDGKTLQMLNHNRILRMDKFKIINPDGTEAVDGLKTGYINAGGSSIILTGKRCGKRAIVIVLGSQSSDLREKHASGLMKDALGSLSW